MSAQPLHILYGHENVVTCVVVNTELDVALSSSKDGTCIVHTARKGNYVRTIRPHLASPHTTTTLPAICISDEGKIVLYARSRSDDNLATPAAPQVLEACKNHSKNLFAASVKF